MIYISEAAGTACIEYLRNTDDVAVIRGIRTRTVKSGAEESIYSKTLPEDALSIKDVKTGTSAADSMKQVTPVYPLVYPGIASHPDIYMCKLGLDQDAPVVFSYPEELGHDYPDDIAFNAACTGRYFIHHLQYTAPRLLDIVRNEIHAHSHFPDEADPRGGDGPGLHCIDVRQGYSKCSIAIVDERSIITSDRGIAKAITRSGHDIDCLLISEGYVKLRGFDHGFIGGTCGLIESGITEIGSAECGPAESGMSECSSAESETAGRGARRIMVFNGDITAHPDADRIIEFISKRNIEIKWFDFTLEDIGSIIQTSSVPDGSAAISSLIL